MGGLAHRKKRLIERDAKQRFAYNTVDNNNSNNVLGNRISNHSVHQRVGGGIQKKTQHINYNNNNNKIAKGNNTSNSYFRRKGNLARLVMACTENLADNGVVAGRCNNNELNIVREEQRHHEERRVDKVSSGISISALLN